MNLEDEMERAAEFLVEFSTEAEDEFGSVVKRIQGMSHVAEEALSSDGDIGDEYIELFDNLVAFAGEAHQATDKIVPSIERVRDVFVDYNTPWERSTQNNSELVP